MEPYSSPPQLNSLLFNTHSYSPTQLLLKPNIPLPNSFYPTFPIHKSTYQTFPYPTFSFTPFPIYSHKPMHNSTTQHSPLHHSQYTATYLCITQLPNIPLIPNIPLPNIPHHNSSSPYITPLHPNIIPTPPLPNIPLHVKSRK